MLFNEVPFMERFAAAAKAGFKGVEYLFPYDFPAEDLAKQLSTHGLTQVLHNLPAGDWGKGERGIAIFPDRVSEFKEDVTKAIAYAKALKCTQLNCLVGVLPQGADAKKAHDTLVSNLKFAAAALKAEGIKLLIEPINTRDIPGFFLTNTKQALALIDEVGSDNLYVQYDIYHMQIMEGDLARTIEANLPKIAHIQLADNPGRNEPGTGEINYPFLYGFIDKLGYKGWIGAEYKPKSDTVAGLGWLPK
jgi:hydroxypyruvate isomerase